VDCICFKAKYFADFGIWWHIDIIEEARCPDLAADICQDECQSLLGVVCQSLLGVVCQSLLGVVCQSLLGVVCQSLLVVVYVHDETSIPLFRSISSKRLLPIAPLAVHVYAGALSPDKEIQAR
jgi:hypothetical protein